MRYDTNTTVVDFEIKNNVWWVDAFQFGAASDTTWSFTGKSFLLDVKKLRTDAAPALALSSGAGTIVVYDATQRILGLYVSDHVVRSTLPYVASTDADANEWVYDLVMVDDGTGERDLLMTGRLCLLQGVTVED